MFGVLLGFGAAEGIFGVQDSFNKCFLREY